MPKESKESIINIISDVLATGYKLESSMSFDGDTCVIWKRLTGWIYPEIIYASTFTHNSFLFYSDEFSYSFTFTPDTVYCEVCDDTPLEDILDDMTPDEIDKMDADIEYADANDQPIFWDEICVTISNNLLQQRVYSLQNQKT